MINGSANQINNSVFEKYCYDNDQANCDTYGGLYQWNEMMDYSTLEASQGLCPEGWHMPTQSEYDELYATVGLDANALKAIGEGTGLGAGTNTSGFSALLAGASDNIEFSGLGLFTIFWNSTIQTGNYSYRTSFVQQNSLISGRVSYNTHGYSARCLKND